MALRWKEIRRIGRSAYVYYPDIPNRTAYKVASVTVVREERSRESGAAGLREKADSVLPEPGGGRLALAGRSRDGGGPRGALHVSG